MPPPTVPWSPPAYPGPASVPRPRIALIIISVIAVVAVLGFVSGCLLGWSLASHSASSDLPPASATTGPAAPAAPTTDVTEIPPEQRPGTKAYEMSMVIGRLGRPTGFDLATPHWTNIDLTADYPMFCPAGSCAVDPYVSVAAWTSDLGSSDFTVDKLKACIADGCRAGIHQYGFTVVLGLSRLDIGSGIAYTFTVSVSGA
jgi:hypothetical protein